jgi:hypothetical protein
LSNKEVDVQPSLPVKLQRKDEISTGNIGVGTNIHRAISIERGDMVTVSKLQKRPYGEKIANRLLRSRPAICRIHKAVLPDPEFRVCRLPSEVMSLIGIEEGDMVVLESPSGTTSVRALETTETMFEQKQKYIKNNPDRYPDCEECLETSKHEVPIDVPQIYIDYDTRADLGLTGDELEGVCQPIRVYRHNQSVFINILDDLSVPVLGLFISLFLIFGNYLSLSASLIAVVVGFSVIISVILIQSIYRARKNI